MYTNIIEIEPMDFETCEKCFKPLEHDHECGIKESERLEGVFEVMDVCEEDYGHRLILKQNDTLVTYLMWESLPFYESGKHVKTGDMVNIIGWRTSNRITNLRKFSKLL